MVKIKPPAHISLNNEGQRPRGLKAILLWDYFIDRRDELLWENLCMSVGVFNVPLCAKIHRFALHRIIEL